ncbi:DUF4179 domain-containing protein [Paenalkalicoccus suaedae]|uniref:DUF4179 domain-containing protein n=1 Tax=Paenalkalicoccus suaedae TaxID=2592382 RepID=A0A859FI52_9BACI|nr:DUF4179 domain-containing protein [Paenalkalicoccus suaedae]QKS71876.1 DUF4179 domain-containing protein [Paenalkalicoccus suaedae]
MDCQACIRELLHNKLSEDCENHLKTCGSCKEVAREIQPFIRAANTEASTIHPQPFLEELTTREPRTATNATSKQDTEAATADKPVQKKKRIAPFLGIAIIALFIGVAIAATSPGFHQWVASFTPYTYTHMDRLVASGYADEIGISETNDGVEFTFTDIVVDDAQAHIHFEITDLERDRVLFINPFSGVEIRNGHSLWTELESNTGLEYYDHSRVKVLESNPGHTTGVIVLDSPEPETGTIELMIGYLYSYEEDQFNDLDNWWDMYELDMEDPFISGQWTADIPYQKRSATHYEVDKAIQNDFFFANVTDVWVGPAGTKLRMEFDHFTDYGLSYTSYPQHLDVNGEEHSFLTAMPDPFEQSTRTMNVYFESTYFDSIEDIAIKYDYVRIYEQISPETDYFERIDDTTFAFEDERIQIVEIFEEDGDTNVHLEHEMHDDRKYDFLSIRPELESDTYSMNMATNVAYTNLERTELIEGNIFYSIMDNYDQVELSRNYLVTFENDIDISDINRLSITEMQYVEDVDLSYQLFD